MHRIYRILVPGLVLVATLSIAPVARAAGNQGQDCPVGEGSPVMNGDLDDWCLDSAPRVENNTALLNCDSGSELVWWDAPADAAVNDLATLATTQNADRLYWALQMHLNPDPASLPFVQIAIDVAPGGSTTSWDPLGKLQAPGNCSTSTTRACTSDADCHFCTVTTEYTGTPNERPRVCGSTDTFDLCDWDNPLDVCVRVETCENLDTAPAVPNLGQFANPATEADYLLVWDFGRWLIGVCDAVLLLRNDGGNWVEVPRSVPDPFCPNPTWRFPILIGPGVGSGPPAGVEVEMDWEAFDCEGCPPFGPGDCFRWTVEISRDLFTFDYRPDGAIEDVMSESVAGTQTRTTNDCPGSGTETTRCEIADGSTDAYVPSDLSFTPGGRVDGLVLSRNTQGTATPSITLSWNPSCSQADVDYEVHEGTIGFWYDHEPVPDLCSTAAATTATFDAGPDDRYYLVVPTDGSTEGSYGTNSDSIERPAATLFCLPQSLGNCP